MQNNEPVEAEASSIQLIQNVDGNKIAKADVDRNDPATWIIN